MDFSRVLMCPVSSDMTSRQLWHWECTYLCVRVVLVLERPCLGPADPSTSLSLLGPTVPGLFIASVLPPWPVVLWQGKCLGASSGWTFPGHSVLFPAVGPPTGILPACWKSWLPLTGWILGVTQSFLYPLGEKVLQHHPRGHPQYARSSMDSWFPLNHSGLWGRHQQFRSAQCPIILYSCKPLLQGLLVPFEVL